SPDAVRARVSGLAVSWRLLQRRNGFVDQEDHNSEPGDRAHLLTKRDAPSRGGRLEASIGLESS
ncbi:MAG: hypothetical protein AAF961_17340, partial [Planctomycetota bacterium]